MLDNKERKNVSGCEEKVKESENREGKCMKKGKRSGEPKGRLRRKVRLERKEEREGEIGNGKADCSHHLLVLAKHCSYSTSTPSISRFDPSSTPSKSTNTCRKSEQCL